MSVVLSLHLYKENGEVTSLKNIFFFKLYKLVIKMIVKFYFW